MACCPGPPCDETMGNSDHKKNPGARIADTQSATIPIPALTGIRFIAAASIVIGHFCGAMSVEVGGLHVALGNLTIVGMPLFFVLSGFVIHLNYGRLFATHDLWTASTRFVVARVARLMPLFLVLLLAYLYADSVMSRMWHDAAYQRMLVPLLTGTFSWLPYRLDTHLLIQSFFGVSWSVSTELFFYLLYPVLGIAIWKVRRIRTVVALNVLLWIGALGILWMLCAHREALEAWGAASIQSVPEPKNDFANSFYRWFCYVSPYVRILEFTAGVLAAQAYVVFDGVRVSRRAAESLTTGTVLLIVLMFLVMLFAFDPRFSAGPWREFVIFLHMNFYFAIPIAVLLFGVARFETRVGLLLASAPLVFLGEISYSLYLTHSLVDRWFATAPVDASTLQIVLGLLVKCVLVVALSLGTYRVIEVPGRRFLRGALGAATGGRARSAAFTLLTLLIIVVALVLGARGTVRMPPIGVGPMTSETSNTARVEAPTNLLWPSNDFSHERWSPLERIRIERIAATGPPGIADAYLVLEDATVGRHRMETVVSGVVLDQPHVFSVFVRANGRQALMVELRDTVNRSYGVATFDVPGRKASSRSGTPSDAGIDAVSPEWVRCWVRTTFGGDTAVLTLTLVDGVGGHNYPGNGVSGLFLSGAQLHVGSTVTSYVATTTGPTQVVPPAIRERDTGHVVR